MKRIYRTRVEIVCDLAITWRLVRDLLDAIARRDIVVTFEGKPPRPDHVRYAPYATPGKGRYEGLQAYTLGQVARLIGSTQRNNKALNAAQSSKWIRAGFEVLEAVENNYLPEQLLTELENLRITFAQFCRELRRAKKRFQTAQRARVLQR